jgi:hypothetical protein
MEVAIGLHAVGLSFDGDPDREGGGQQGYGRVRTGTVGDLFQTCEFRWAAARDANTDGIGPAIGVTSVGLRTRVPTGLPAHAQISSRRSRVDAR